MESKKKYLQNQSLMSIAGLLLLFLPIIILGLWISVFSSNPTASQTEKVEIYLAYFPLLFRSVTSISLVTIVSAVGSIVLTALGLKGVNWGFKIIGIVVIIIASLVLLLQLFSLL